MRGGRRRLGVEMSEGDGCKKKYTWLGAVPAMSLRIQARSQRLVT